MKAVFWHRRDLRIEDNAALYYALKQNREVIPVFIFDQEILKNLPKNDARVSFIYEEIQKIKSLYHNFNSDLHVFFGNPTDLIPQLAASFQVSKVYANKDYEPYAIARDKFIFEKLKDKNIEFIAKKDHVIFEKNEVLKQDATPYKVFTPYAKRWKELCDDFYLKAYPVDKYSVNLSKLKQESTISLKALGFEKSLQSFPNCEINEGIVKDYHLKRDLPYELGTSRLSVHLRFGTLSIRKLSKYAQKTNQTFLNELIWRDFYQMLLYHFPHSAAHNFKPEYDKVKWEFSQAHFEAWCNGLTGYPLVDAGMRELNATGFMHNRVRMVVASFFCKHLLMDWRIGERYFAEKLNDFELASNVGGWQWASGTGCDAAPYFRVFNPTLQQQKFDPKFIYIKKWIPEFGTSSYPTPIVDHDFARKRAIDCYKEALK